VKAISKGLATLAVLTMLSNSIEAATDAHIKQLIKEECHRQAVDPAFPLAVAHIESRKIVKDQIVREFRTGLIGKGKKKYYAPFNIHPDYLKKGWRIDDLKENIYYGVRRLKQGPSVLPFYNKSCTQAYIKAVKKATRRYQDESTRLQQTGQQHLRSVVEGLAD